MSGPRAASGRQTILIVDDTPTHIQILGDILGDDYEVRFARGGREALDHIDRSLADGPLPDLILLDILMPEMDGYEVCRRLKADPRTRDILVIFITVKDGEADEAEGLAVGAVDYITKPFGGEIVKARVRTHLDLKRYRDDLEQRVSERTAEIMEANDRLREEIEKTRRIRDQLVQVETLATTGRLAATVAHEVNTPLQGITSLLDNLSYLCSETDGADEIIGLVKRAFTQIRDTVRRLHSLNLPVRIRKQPVNLNDTISETAAILGGMSKKRGIRLQLALDPDLPRIHGAPQALTQVFINLMANAIDAMPDGGRVTVTTAVSGDDAVATVADTGPGLAEADLPHLFSPFFTREKPQGMGIGLFVCRGIVADHGGSLSAANTLDGGAAFTVRLPLPEPDPDG